MNGCYVGIEFTHDRERPNAKLFVKSRPGPVKRWVDAGVPHMVEGKLRERVALQMPPGFRFRKDVVASYAKNKTWSDGKFFMAMNHATGKYIPHAKPKQISAQPVDAQPGVESPKEAVVAADQAEATVVERPAEA